MNYLTAAHFADNYLINPTNPITVNQIGAGGTGSRMIGELGRMNEGLIALGHPGLHVRLYDDDIATEANKGRLLIADCEIGLPKSVIFINRANRTFGTNWKAITAPFSPDKLDSLPDHGSANLYISCVDTVAARFGISRALNLIKKTHGSARNRPLYWLDLGNARYTGQGILSTIGEIRQPASKRFQTVACLPAITDEFKNLLEAEADNKEPSCSLAEALEKQDLYINGVIAGLGATLLFHLIRNAMTESRGFFHNAQQLRTVPLPVA